MVGVAEKKTSLDGPAIAPASLKLDLAADQRSVTFHHVEQLVLVNANSSDLSNFQIGQGVEARQVAGKKKDSDDSGGAFKLDADRSVVERVDVEGAADIRAKSSKVRDIMARKSAAPDRYRTLGGVAALVVGGLLLALGHEAAPTSLTVKALGTNWSVVSSVPGVVLAVLGAIVLVVPSRKP